MKKFLMGLVGIMAGLVAYPVILYADPDTPGSAALAGDTWESLIEIRDNSDTWPEGKTDGGWWVTPIHATLLPQSGKVLITGWERRDRDNCAPPDGARKYGTSFEFDPAKDTETTLYIEPLDEQGLRTGTTQDVLYCAGQAPMYDGRILYVGGSRYTNLGYPGQTELGLDYARVYDPESQAFTRVKYPFGGDPEGANLRWYPSVTRLADGRMLVSGGFTQCCDFDAYNRSLQVFDLKMFDANRDPWSTLVSHEESRPEMDELIQDYPRVFLLPQEVTADGRKRQVAILGSKGKVLLLNTDAPNLTGEERLIVATGERPGGADYSIGYAGLALTSTNRIMVMGGSLDPKVVQQVDFYDVEHQTWGDPVDTGIGRRFPASVLLPTGKTLIINGGPFYKDEYLNFPALNYKGDRRQPQIIDPTKPRDVETYNPWPDKRERGYHSIALLLKDGRVLVGGGVSSDGGVGCERPDLQIYNPTYLSGERPRFKENVSEPVGMTVGGNEITLDYHGGALQREGGVVLMAPGSFTHHFDNNQRYVALEFTAEDGKLRVKPPPNTSIAPEGDYVLYLVSQSGTPSEGKWVHLNAAPG